MCATGNPIGAKEAFDCGLVDRLVEGELIPHAVAYAEEVRDVRPLPKSSERRTASPKPIPRVFDEFRKANARKFRGFDAPRSQYRGGQGRDRKAVSPKASSKSANCSWS